MKASVRILEVGVLHSRDACALCGSSTDELRRTVVLSTRASAMRCVDEIECLRRSLALRYPWRAAA
jgi:hypothetical protein